MRKRGRRARGEEHLWRYGLSRPAVCPPGEPGGLGTRPGASTREPPLLGDSYRAGRSLPPARQAREAASCRSEMGRGSSGPSLPQRSWPSCSGRSRPLPGRPGCSGRTWHMVHEEGDEPSNPALVSAFKSHGWSRGLRLGSGEDAVSQALDGRCGLPLVYVVSLYESGGRKSAPSGLTQPHAWAGKLEVPLSKEKSAHYSGWARARARPLGLSSHLPSPLAAVTQCVNCTTAHLWPGRHNFGGI